VYIEEYIFGLLSFSERGQTTTRDTFLLANDCQTTTRDTRYRVLEHDTETNQKIVLWRQKYTTRKMAIISLLDMKQGGAVSHTFQKP
jgi:hypothetical protein